MIRLLKQLLSDRRTKMIVILFSGIICGLAILIIYQSKAASYLSNEPATCVNCHIMAPFYATWAHSSHGRNTNCNDCHVPHDNVFRKYFFKGKDGMRHAAIFTMNGQPQVIHAIDESAGVIMENCVRCHSQLNTDMISLGKLSYEQVKEGEGKACWDCHRNVPHMGVNSLSAAPNALVPYAKTEVPQWLKMVIK